jgi:hypothetical protein
MRNAHRTFLERARGRAALAGRLCRPRHARAYMHRSLSLAEAIAARYATLERRWPALALVFGEREQPGREAHLATLTSIFLNPRLLLYTPAMSHAERTLDTQMGMPAEPNGAASPLQPVPRAAARTAPARTGIIERIVRRTHREERARRPAAPSAAATSGWQTPGPGAVAPATSSSASGVVVRRGQGAVADRGAARERAKTDPERPPDTVARKALPSAPGPSDITRITDQVMQMLDRRIVAQRERMGRV